MKTAFIAVAIFVSIVGVASAQSSGAKTAPATFVMTGNSFRQEGMVNHARGNVVVRTDTIEILADEVDFNSATGELDARGHVTVTPALPPSAASAGVQPKNVSEKPGLAQDLDVARATLARMTDLASKGLAPRAEVERAQAEVNRLQSEASRELVDKGLLPRPEALRTPNPPDASGSSAGRAWVIQTDALKLKLAPGK